MNEMSKLKDKMKKKVKLDGLHGDKVISPYDVKTVKEQGDKGISECGDMPPNTQVDKASKKQATKSRLTVYLDAETEALFNQMYADKIVKGEKVDKSSMVCEAIRLLHKN